MRLSELLEKTVAILKSDGFWYFQVESKEDPRIGLEEELVVTRSSRSEDPGTWEIGLTSTSFNLHAGNSPTARRFLQKFDEIPYAGWEPV